MNAVILAGGRGVRLRPLTDHIPKPLLPIANKPIIRYGIDALRAAHIFEIILTLGYKAQQIASANPDCTAVIESEPQGTLGSVKAIEDRLSAHFVVLSGDALSDINLSAMLDRHRAAQSLVTIAVTPSHDPSRYGVVEAEAGFVTRFIEKPKRYPHPNPLVNCGIYIIDRRVLDLVEPGVPRDFSLDLFPLMLAKGLPIAVYVHQGYWCDIGDPKSYFNANFRTKNTQNNLFGNRSIVTNSCITDSIIGNNCFVENASLNRCIVLDNTTVTTNQKNTIFVANSKIKI